MENQTLKLPMKPGCFMQLGLRFTASPSGERNDREELRCFRTYYGVSPVNASLLWAKIRERELAPRARPFHLLIGLYFLTVYSTDKVGANFFHIHEATYREWSDIMVRVIAKLKPIYIKWENRLKGNNCSNCKVSVDGTDYRIPQQAERKTYYSHKFKTSGYRYEIALCIATGHVVWTNGPYPCGSYPDINIFRRALKGRLRSAGEKALADLGYRGERALINTPNNYDSALIRKIKKDTGMRHETVNKRLKRYGALGQKFRHRLTKHKSVFEACVTLVQMGISSDEPLYQVQYGKLPLQHVRGGRRLRQT